MAAFSATGKTEYTPQPSQDVNVAAPKPPRALPPRPVHSAHPIFGADCRPPQTDVRVEAKFTIRRGSETVVYRGTEAGELAAAIARLAQRALVGVAS